MHSKLSIFVVVLSSIAVCQGNGGSKCQGTSCTPAPSGTTCEAKYGRDDGCCPEWVCANGQSIYGMSKSSGGGSSSFSSSSFGFGSPGGFGGLGGLPGLPGLPPLPFFGRR